MNTFQFAAVYTPISLEPGYDEITSMGGLPENKSDSLIQFRADLATGYRFLLHTKLATRLSLLIANTPVSDIQDIKNTLFEIDWQQHLRPGQNLSVQCLFSKEHKATLNTHKIAKDFEAIIRDQAPSSETNNPSHTYIEPLKLIAFYHASSFMLGIDFSGASLHERGYRKKAVDASLKETLAAAIIAQQPPEQQIDWCLDPCCGSATLLIEAAIQWADLPANIHRQSFACSAWRQHDDNLFRSIKSTSLEAFETAFKQKWPRFVGYDADPKAVEAARLNIQAAGLTGKIHVERRDWSRFEPSPLNQWGKGYLIANPPYGKRLQQPETLRYLYQHMGRKLAQLEDAQVTLMSSDIDSLDALRLDYQTQIRSYNGALPLFIRYGLKANKPLDYHYNRLCPVLQAGEHTQIESEEAVSKDLANRIHKNYRKLKKWLDQPLTGPTQVFIGNNNEANQPFTPINSYRIYDADLPEFNISIDCYEHCILVHEYKAPKSIDLTKAKNRLTTAINTIKAVFKLPKQRIYVKQRQQQKGKQQYKRNDRKNQYFSINEWNARLLVNLSDFLDTGVFLDHRILRLYFQQHAAGKHFLNLFSYTGSASVQAALGGAKSTTSVDLSGNYNEWAVKNFCINGIGGPNHEFITADALAWIQSTSRNFDLIFVDPPTFSNSKKANDFCVQQHHQSLLEACMKRLAPNGQLFFSCNFKKFAIDQNVLAHFNGEEISEVTQSPDFSRGKSAHHRCWLFQKP